jgi:excisionase family DNA binding protein
MKDLISSKEAAKKLGVSIRRVQALITSGKLPAQKIGNSYVVQEKDLELVKNRQPGRPPRKSGNQHFVRKG